MVSCCSWSVWHWPLEASTPGVNSYFGLEFQPEDPWQATACYTPENRHMSFSQGSLFRFHLEFRGNILSTLDTFPQLHPKTSTFEGVLESEWGHHEAGIGMRSGVFCSLGKRMKVLDAWNYPYWFLWRYIGFSWFETFKSPEKKTWTCGFSCGFLKQQQVGQVGLIDYYCTLHFGPHSHHPWTVNHF